MSFLLKVKQRFPLNCELTKPQTHGNVPPAVPAAWAQENKLSCHHCVEAVPSEHMAGKEGFWAYNEPQEDLCNEERGKDHMRVHQGFGQGIERPARLPLDLDAQHQRVCHNHAGEEALEPVGGHQRCEEGPGLTSDPADGRDLRREKAQKLNGERRTPKGVVGVQGDQKGCHLSQHPHGHAPDLKTRPIQDKLPLVLKSCGGRSSTCERLSEALLGTLSSAVPTCGTKHSAITVVCYPSLGNMANRTRETV